MNNRTILGAFAILCVAMMVATSFVCLNDNVQTGDSGDIVASDVGLEGDIVDGVSVDDTEALGYPLQNRNSDRECDFWVESLGYSINSDGYTVSVKDYDGDESRVVVPNQVSYGGWTYTVTEIADYGLGTVSVFERELEYIELGPSIVKIGKGGLSDVEGDGASTIVFRDIEQSNLRYIDDGAFEGTQIESLVLPASVEYIGKYVFYECDDLAHIEIRSTNLVIAQYAFSECTGLEEISLDSVKEVPAYAFYRCTSLKSVDIPSATTVGDCAFELCCDLETANLPSATSMGRYAFGFCNDLKTLIAPLITEIAENMLYCCKHLQTVDMRSVTEVPEEEFEDFDELVSVNFASATKIGQSAFEGCTKLKNVDISSATYIDSYCFKDCDSLEIINLPSVTYVSWQSFKGCDNLHEVYMPVAYHISGEAFYGVDSLTKVVFSDQLTYVGEDAFNCASFYHFNYTGGATGNTWTQLNNSAESLNGKTFEAEEGCEGHLVEVTIQFRR